jgi:O-antigen/teichoic acid export membrane protein
MIDALRVVPYAVLGALFPAAARSALPRDRSPRLGAAGDIPELALLAFALILSITLTAVAAPLVRIIFGPGYSASVAPLQVLVWSLMPYVVAARASLHLVASDREAVVLRALALALPVALALNLTLVESFGPVGASIAAVAAEAFLAAVLLLFVRRAP